MNKTRKMLLASTSHMIRAFENNAGWKMDGDKLALDGSGNPIYVDASGRELSVGGDTISRLNGEAKQHRERAEKAEKTIEAFKDIDPEKARGALEQLSKIDQKKLIDAGEIDKVREEVGKTFTAQIGERDKALADANTTIDHLMLDNAFNTSKFINEKIDLPVDIVRSTFGGNFKREDGKLVPYDGNGNKIYSPKRAGEIADFDEAFEVIVGNYAHKDRILKAPGGSGSGNNGGGGNRGSGGRQMSRAQFEAMSPIEKANAGAAMSKGELTLTD